MKELINVEQPVTIGSRDWDLLETPTTGSINLEFTSRCNLRCVYCSLSHPDYIGQDLTCIGDFDAFVKDLKARSIDKICISGTGETLILKDWRSYCQKLLEAGFSLTLISNFAREMDQEDYDTLARLSQIDVSCDTVDLKLFRKLRRGADFRMLVYNMARVRAAACKNGHEIPLFAWSCVVTDQNILGLENYVATGISMGVRQFNFCNLAKISDLPHADSFNHVCEMPREQFYEALGALERALKLIKGFGLKFVCHDGLLDSINARVNQDQAKANDVTRQTKVEERSSWKEEGGMGVTTYSAQPQSGQTRDCLDPWNYAIVRADGGVTPCCFYSPVGSLSSGQSINDILNNSSIKRLRQNLLSGDLDTACRTCPGRPLTDCGTLREKVRDHLAQTG
ncbi:MAG: hypothetical protein NPIRA02_02990 [Nitrospirales bacterium]|nr:MAG: hypothetical protein NPIRA02_02990 [Nitrospirales bacterium]